MTRKTDRDLTFLLQRYIGNRTFSFEFPSDIILMDASHEIPKMVRSHSIITHQKVCLHIYAMRFWCLAGREIAVLAVQNCENLFSVNKYAQRVAHECVRFIIVKNRIESDNREGTFRGRTRTANTDYLVPDFRTRKTKNTKFRGSFLVERSIPQLNREK